MSTSKTLVKKNSCIDKILSSNETSIFESKKTVFLKKPSLNIDEEDQKSEILMERKKEMKKKDTKINGLQDRLKKAEEMA